MSEGVMERRTVDWTLLVGTAVLMALLVILFYPPFWQSVIEVGFRWVFILLFAWSIAAVMTPIAIRLSHRIHCVDHPEGRKDHANDTPLLGGLAIIAAFGLTLLATFHYSAPMKGVGLGGLLIWLLGVIDDRYSLPATLKLLVQLAAVMILFVFNVHFTFLPNTPLGQAGEYILTAIWVIGILNAVNFLDGMDGLATGMSAVIAGFLGLVALQTNQFYFSAVALALFGACLGFLPYNFRWKKSARIFLGDNGSTFLGFILASAAIMGDWAEDDVAALIVPIVLMGVPIFDMTMTTVTRFWTGKVRTLGEWLAYTGRDHLHHRLAALGIGRGTAVLVIWALTFFLGITAVMLTHAEGVFALLMLLQAGMLLALVTFFMIYVRSHQIRLFIQESNRNGESSCSPDRESLEAALKSSDKPES